MFIHLRVHSVYSLLESSVKIEELIALCLHNKMPAVAITDSGNLFGSLEFAEYAASKGIQPIIGCNVTVKHFDQNLSILLIAKDEQGYANLVTLVSESFRKRKSNSDVPYIDFNELLSLSTGLIALTGGYDGVLTQLLLRSD
ncbi:MAG TPA: DNA polymerase III subunit alpha, partial [Wolbachia sp.]|nr:DNA polymerase III subunit alpha [Wolbachia sp.]